MFGSNNEHTNCLVVNRDHGPRLLTRCNAVIHAGLDGAHLQTYIILCVIYKVIHRQNSYKVFTGTLWLLCTTNTVHNKQLVHQSSPCSKVHRYIKKNVAVYTHWVYNLNGRKGIYPFTNSWTIFYMYKNIPVCDVYQWEKMLLAQMINITMPSPLRGCALFGRTRYWLTLITCTMQQNQTQATLKYTIICIPNDLLIYLIKSMHLEFGKILAFVIFIQHTKILLAHNSVPYCTFIVTAL